MIKQVIVVRTDLNMRKGKMCAQVAHASMKVFFDRMYENIEDSSYSNSDFHCDFTNQMIEWKNGSFAKIVVGCNSEQDLFDLQKQAEEADIVNAIILDNGNTEFKEICPKCNGTRLYTPKGNVGLDVLDCMTCNGTGKLNKPTYTCFAIGPDEVEKIEEKTGHLKLL